MQLYAAETAALIENLRIVFEAELTAQARYTEFAQVAEYEGWVGVAGLFRAASAAEGIHAGNHGRILRQFEEEIDFTPGPVEAENTLHNLRIALAGELEEIDSLYPAFLQQARECRDVTVVRTLNWALEAEKTHARLFNEALTLVEFNDRDAWVTMNRDFYVCPVCGYTSEVANELPLCPVCNCAWNRFELYN